MASTGQTWTLVAGKSAKKSKVQDQKLSKNQRKAMFENMPKLESNFPIQYEEFLTKNERNGKVSSQDKNKSTDSNKNSSKKASTPKRSKPVSDVDKPSNLDQAIKRLQASELEAVLIKDQATFPDNPNVWLKDIASMLNLELESVPEGDPVFSGKPDGYPCNLLPHDVNNLLIKTLKQGSDKLYDLFFEHCMQSMINDMAKGIPTHGHRILLQLIARRHPRIVLSKLQKYKELMNAQKKHPLRCLSVMWAIGQAGKTDISYGLGVWLEALQPMLEVRALSIYVVDYLEDLFKKHKNIKSAYSVFGFRNFFPVLDLIFSSDSNFSTSVQKKLQDLYPKLKEISFGAKPEENLRQFFPSFLARLTQKVNKKFKTELLDSLVECLAVDKQCFSVWRQMYTKHLYHSSILLQHILDNWDKLSSKLEKKLLKETILAFSITNEELAASGNNARDEGFKKCVTVCKELVLKMNRMRFPWRSLVLLLIVTIAGIVSYDAYKAGSLKKSKTVKVLEEYGILVFLEQVWHRILIYTNKAALWLQNNVPHYYSKTCEFLGPYLTLFWEKLYELGVYLAEVTKPQRDWLNRKVPELLEWVQSKLPWLTETIGHYLNIVWAFTLKYSVWLWQILVHYTHIAVAWLQENVFTGQLSGENIMKTLSSSLAVVQTYSSSAVQWIVQLFNSSK